MLNTTASNKFRKIRLRHRLRSNQLTCKPEVQPQHRSMINKEIQPSTHTTEASLTPHDPITNSSKADIKKLQGSTTPPSTMNSSCDRCVEIQINKSTYSSVTYHNTGSTDSFESGFSCSNVIKSTRAYVEPPTSFTIVTDKVFCVPHYPNHLLLNEDAVYYPKKCAQPLDVHVKDISGEGRYRKVTLECRIPRTQQVFQGLERGTLVFAPNHDNAQPIDYSPSPLELVVNKTWDTIGHYSRHVKSMMKSVRKTRQGWKEIHYEDEKRTFL